MHGIADLAGAGLAVAVGFMTVCWIISAVRRDASILDQAWGASVVLVAATYLTISYTTTWRAILAVLLTGIWGVRLTGHLALRSRGEPEEWRHREARVRMGTTRFTLVSLVTLFWFQALAAVAVSTPHLAVFATDQPPGVQPFDVLGILLCCAGVGTEGVADRQLQHFRSSPGDGPGVLATGLWRYSRHPNYFGDALTWWGLGLIGLSTGSWWALAGPAGMTAVLLWVTGVRSMDEHLLTNRGSAYRRYIETTSAFVPRPPRQARPASREPSHPLAS
jgi:steroid 5-alpha reductase family enzyme